MSNRGPEWDTNPGMSRPQQPQQQFPQQSQRPPQRPEGQFGSGQQPYQFGGGGQPQQPMYNQGPAAQSNNSSNKGLIIGLVIGIIALLTAVAGLLAWNMGLFDRGSESAAPTVVEVVTETAEETNADESGAPAAEPSGAPADESRNEPSQTAPRPAPAPEQDRPRGSDYTSYSPASSVTSEQFARAVAVAFQDHVDRTGTTNGTISAYSPVTGQTYSMNCVDHGSYVSCSGGNNAVVHIS